MFFYSYNFLKSKQIPMASEKEYTSATRTLKIFRIIIESSKRYTKQALAQKFNVSKDTIEDAFKAIKTAGFNLEHDNSFRYHIVLDKSFEYLKSLLVFSTKEENLIIEGLQNIKHDNTTVERLMRKISRIYDASKMNNTFNKNFLTKMDILEKSILDENVVIFKNYHSTNSNTIKDRHVEVFQVNAEDDIVHAYDLQEQAVRHFRISRISRVDATEKPFEFKKRHIPQPTDPFRIHDTQQVKVHLRLKVRAYNQLLEQYPVTRAYLKPSSESPDVYDFECKVNHRFYGLSNFIMGEYESITEILEPESLIDFIKEEAKKIIEKKF
jgi:predicted DNA-binding transcriptional regulator YafY